MATTNNKLQNKEAIENENSQPLTEADFSHCGTVRQNSHSQGLLVSSRYTTRISLVSLTPRETMRVLIWVNKTDDWITSQQLEDILLGPSDTETENWMQDFNFGTDTKRLYISVNPVTEYDSVASYSIHALGYD
ncbi:hypothetical protein ABW636_21695 [Aquimarina sp. 2201CG1-2-11]|uniref:hypothetical protein n=1 Tax=Aquimarina discodermiae TaxID=3231043 RepID=UPI0034632509